MSEINIPSGWKHFDSETHALVCGALFAVLFGQFATDLGKLFRTGCEVSPIVDGDNWTKEIELVVGDQRFVIRCDEVDR